MALNVQPPVPLSDVIKSVRIASMDDCKNCGAPLNIVKEKCTYCESPINFTEYKIPQSKPASFEPIGLHTMNNGMQVPVYSKDFKVSFYNELTKEMRDKLKRPYKNVIL